MTSKPTSEPTLGVLGAGQLGRMLAQAGQRIGVRIICYDPSHESCAGDVCEVVHAAYDDEAAISAFAKRCAAVTLEFENVPARALEVAARHAPVRPGENSLRTGQDRVLEKQAFEACGVPVHPWARVDDERSLREAIAAIGLPGVLKRRHGGYDGKGQWVLRSPGDVALALRELAGAPAIFEAFVPFSRELSAIVVRAADGATGCYPIVQNRHERGILRESIAPAQEVPHAIQDAAMRHARAIADRVGHVGVLALELFMTESGDILANEFAPRVHNSGHWTIEGARTSQFENHVRAVMGLPLGSCEALGCSVMVNLIGQVPDRSRTLMIPGAQVHLYGKESRPGRKVGHATFVEASATAAMDRARAAIELARECDTR